jgi:uncharacterized protein YbcI
MTGDLSALSNAMVGLYKEQFGRGPTKARTDYAGGDIIVVTLEETLTPAERKLVAMGEHERLRELRLFTQHAMAPDMIDAVERIAGRKVRGFVSGLDAEQNIATEVFYFEPDGGEVTIQRLGSALRGLPHLA